MRFPSAQFVQGGWTFSTALSRPVYRRKRAPNSPRIPKLTSNQSPPAEYTCYCRRKLTSNSTALVVFREVDGVDLALVFRIAEAFKACHGESNDLSVRTLGDESGRVFFLTGQVIEMTGFTLLVRQLRQIIVRNDPTISRPPAVHMDPSYGSGVFGIGLSNAQAGLVVVR